MAILCGTATNPELCGSCPNRATFKCSDCDNMPYCSKTCQDGDLAQHKTLCDQFKDFQEEHRPSPKHRRVIFFPYDEDRPRFVWLKYHGGAKHMYHDLEDLGKYIGNPENIQSFDGHQELHRQWHRTFWMQANNEAARLPVNRSLQGLLGPYAARNRGPIICMAPLKYRPMTESCDYDAEDQGDEVDYVLIPYDLDTTSLAMHVACLRFRARTGYAY